MRPNILLLLPDQHRGDWLDLPHGLPSAAGPPELRMPVLRSIMERGTVFSQAVSPSPICAPARACLATGTRYFQCGVPDNTSNFNPSSRTFYQDLRNAGYAVMSAGKLDLHKATKYWGEAGWIDDLGEIGFTSAVDNEGKLDAIIGSMKEEPGNPTGRIEGFIDLESQHRRGPYIRYLHDRGKAAYHVADMRRRLENPRDVELTELADEDYCDNWLTQNALELLDSVGPGAPWFLQVNFTGPHDPWDITREMARSIEGRDFGVPHRGDPEHTETDRRIRAHYGAMLENIDRNIGRLLGAVERRHESESTVVIYASDHGEMLGDRGRFGKSIPDRASSGVPLVIGGGPAGSCGMDSSLVELQDLAATILDFAGCDTSAYPQSRSLLGRLAGTGEVHREVQVSALGSWRMIRNEDWTCIDYGDRCSLHANTGEASDEDSDLALENRLIAEDLRRRMDAEFEHAERVG